MPNWDKIRNEWEASKITLKALAEKHGVKLGTLKSRKSRESWSRDSTKKDATKHKKVATPGSEKVATSRKKVATKVNEQFESIDESVELTDKQRLFCMYYIKYWNAGKAAKKAGYESSYYNGIYEIGYQLLQKTPVKSKISELKKNITENIYIESLVVLQKYIDIAFADITDFVMFGNREVIERDSYTGNPIVNDDGEIMKSHVSFVDLVDSNEVDGTILTEVKQGKDGISVKLADKMKALDMLSKYFELLSDSDKERYQLEKLKAETAKTNAEIEAINDVQGQEEAEDWVAGLKEVANKRRGLKG